MKTLSITDPKLQFTDIAKLVQTEPVQMLGHKEPAFVALSLDDYQRIKEMEHNSREGALKAFKDLQDEIASHKLNDEQKQDILSEFDILDDE